MKRHSFGLWLVTVVSVWCAAGVSATPITATDRSSFNRLNGLPLPLSASLLGEQQSSHALQFELTSQFALDDTGGQFALLDGETAELHYLLRKGLAERWELTLDLPYIHQSGGSLDSFVENWHSAFSLPNGGRERFEQNQLRYQIDTPTLQYQYRENSAGLGDIGVGARYQLMRADERALAISLRVDLPTGDEKQLLGSGGVDIASSIDYQNKAWLGRWADVVELSLGALWYGDSNILPEVANDVAYFGSISSRTRLWYGWLMDLQVQAHTAMYDLPTAVFDRATAVGSFALAKPISQHYEWRLGISEDLVTKSSQDFTLFVSVERRAL